MKHLLITIAALLLVGCSDPEAEANKLFTEASQLVKEADAIKEPNSVEAFNKRKEKISEQILVCKEDKQMATKSAMLVLAKILSLFNLAQQTLDTGQDAQLEQWMGDCLEGLQHGLSNTQNMGAKLFLTETAIFVVLMPQIFKLQLLVEDRELEKQLRREALRFLERL